MAFRRQHLPRRADSVHHVPPLQARQQQPAGFGRPSNRAAGEGEDEALHSLRAQWQPFDHWQRLQAREQAELAWAHQGEAADFDLDLTSAPGPLSQEPMMQPRRQPALQEPNPLRRRGPHHSRAAPVPKAGQWQQHLEEELRREEAKLAREAQARAAEVARARAEAEAQARAQAEAEAQAREWARVPTPPGPDPFEHFQKQKARSEAEASAARRERAAAAERSRRAAEQAAAAAQARLATHETAWCVFEQRACAVSLPSPPARLPAAGDSLADFGRN